MNSPSERKLLTAERELKKKSAGAQKAVSEGIYLRLDRDGTRRFHVRGRGTYGTWQEAEDARAALLAASEDGKDGGPTRAQMRIWTIERYAEGAWWPTVANELDALTQLDYRNGLKDLLPYVEGVTLLQLLERPLLIDELKRKVAQAKTYPPRPGEQPKFHKAAADKPLKILRAICGHAAEREVLPRNPVAGIRLFNRSRSASGGKDAPSHRRVLASEIKHPRTVILAAVGMRGDPATLAGRRLVPKLIALGLRPSDIGGLRHYCWRDRNGALDYLQIKSAVKDLGGHLIEGEPKTGKRSPRIFPFLAEELERIYQLQGCPDLDALVIPNTDGGLLDFGNWRTQVWYPSLHRAGLADGPHASARGAFDPYALRHAGVAVMLHANRPEGGTYSRTEVALQFGHHPATLDRVYADIPTDMHGIAGLTMDEIFRNAQREVWGPAPGDPDYDEIEYDLLEAATLTGLSRTSLAGRITRGSIPGVKRRGKYYVTRWDLAWHGLLSPGSQRR